MRYMTGAVLIVAVLACPAWAVFSDGFNYPDGALGGNDGWSGSTAGAVDVQAQQVLITSGGPGSASIVATNDIVDIAPDANGKIYGGAKVWGAAGGANNIWSIYWDDPAGLNFARWYGRSDSARPRIGPYGQVLSEPTLSFNGWDVLTIEIDTINKQSSFSFNGNLLGSLAYAQNQPAIGTTLGSIRIERMANANLGQSILIDDVWATPEPASWLLLCTAGLLLRRK